MITNKQNIPFALAVWAVDDSYDYNQTFQKYLSATTIIKPVKQIILGSRVKEEDTDASDYIATSLGSTIHAGIEKAWNNYKDNLRKLGYANNFIQKIKINPEPEDIKEDTFPIYIEQRSIKNLDGYVIGGKFDFVFGGNLHDIKTTSVYTYMGGSRDRDYQLQGSIYRWLNQDKINGDILTIDYIFTDWSKIQSLRVPDYPKQRFSTKELPLLSIEETENYLKHKIRQIDQFFTLPEERIPRCTDDELWRTETTYKYYANPDKTTGKSTKNFTFLNDAAKYKNEKGKGVIIAVPGEVRRCQYCSAYSICKQRREYFND